MKLHEDADYTLHHTSILILLELVLHKIFDEGLGDSVYHDLIRMRREYASDSHEYSLIGNLISSIKKDWGELLDEEEASILDTGSLETESERTTDKPRDV